MRIPCSFGLLVLGTAALAFSNDPAVSASVTESRRTAIVRAIERVSPAVVTINATVIEQRVVSPFPPEILQFFGLFDLREFQPQVRRREIRSIGTGFIFDAQGHILTNYHVVEDADALSVTLPDGRTLDVDLVGSDWRTDIAVLRAKASGLPYVTLGDSETLMVGEWVIAIGNPFGTLMRDPQPSVSVGVVSANHRRGSREVGGGDRFFQDLIQTDAAINPGNSGGPLVNAVGEVVGINTMIFSRSGGSEGLGFAIPINRAKRVAAEIIQYGRRRSPWMGFRGTAVEELPEYSLQQLDIRVTTGVLVTEVVTTAPAYKAGLRVGDVVVRVNGEPVRDPKDVDYLNYGMFVGDTVQIEINRRGEKRTLRFPIEEVSTP